MEVCFAKRDGSFPTFGIRQSAAYGYKYILASKTWDNVIAHSLSIDDLVELFAKQYGDDDVDVEFSSSTPDFQKKRLLDLYNTALESRTVSIESEEISELI